MRHPFWAIRIICVCSAAAETWLSSPAGIYVFFFCVSFCVVVVPYSNVPDTVRMFASVFISVLKFKFNNNTIMKNSIFLRCFNAPVPMILRFTSCYESSKARYIQMLLCYNLFVWKREIFFTFTSFVFVPSEWPFDAAAPDRQDLLRINSSRSVGMRLART